MEPIVESLDVLTLSARSPGVDLVEHLPCAAEHVVEAVPECVGMTIARFSRGVTFTLVATSQKVRILDAAQYLAGGPCERAAWEGAEVDLPDVFDVERWPFFGLASAKAGVKSSLSLPLRHSRQLLGSVNLYGSTPDAFRGRDRELPVMFGAVVELMLHCEESLTRDRTARNSEISVSKERLDRAVKILVRSEQLAVSDARSRLLLAAERAGIGLDALVELVLEEPSNR
jgi:GAF domain-containing protein